MPAHRRIVRRACLIVACFLASCSDPTSGGSPTTVFVLRSIGGASVPATITSGAYAYTILADTLFVAAQSDSGQGILERTLATRDEQGASRVARGQHAFFWRGQDVSVFFACQWPQPCPAIYSYELGSLGDRTLVFPARGPYSRERSYERLR